MKAWEASHKNAYILTSTTLNSPWARKFLNFDIFLWIIKLYRLLIGNIKCYVEKEIRNSSAVASHCGDEHFSIHRVEWFNWTVGCFTSREWCTITKRWSRDFMKVKKFWLGKTVLFSAVPRPQLTPRVSFEIWSHFYFFIFLFKNRFEYFDEKEQMEGYWIPF